MNTYTIETPTLDTLSDFFALHPDPADVARRLPVLRENIEAGRVLLENLLILRSDRGIEGTALIAQAVQVPVFPRFRPDVAPEGMTALARAIHIRTGPEHRLVLQDDQAPLNAAAIEAAGWVLDDHQPQYQTDLHARPYRRDPQAVEGGADWLDRPEVQALLQAQGETDYELGGRERLVRLPGGEGLAAFGKIGSSGRPGYANIHLIGVLPGARGRGLGTRLHEHLLALAAEEHTHHGGSTRADNHAMRRIYAKNGSELVATHLYFRPS